MGKSNFCQIWDSDESFANSQYQTRIQSVQIEKLYYTISEVADFLKLNQSVLRYWETEFEHVQPRKTKKGDRLYTQKDIDDLRLIFHLLKEKGYTIEGAKKHLRESKMPKSNQMVLQSLLKIRQNLEKLKTSIE